LNVINLSEVLTFPFSQRYHCGPSHLIHHLSPFFPPPLHPSHALSRPPSPPHSTLLSYPPLSLPPPPPLPPTTPPPHPQRWSPRPSLRVLTWAARERGEVCVGGLYSVPLLTPFPSSNVTHPTSHPLLTLSFSSSLPLRYPHFLSPFSYPRFPPSSRSPVFLSLSCAYLLFPPPLQCHNAQPQSLVTFFKRFPPPPSVRT